MPDRSYLQSKWISAFLLVLVCLNFLWMGCGKKGPPQPPRRPLPPAIKDLTHVIYGDKVELSWTVPGTEDHKASLPVAVKVFRSRLSAEEASCENCPIRFSVSGDIPIEQQRSEKSKPIRMRYTEDIEPGYRYVYKVIALDEYGISGRDSNIVKFDHHPD